MNDNSGGDSDVDLAGEIHRVSRSVCGPDLRRRIKRCPEACHKPTDCPAYSLSVKLMSV
jgi:hypothetical protein